MSPEYAMEGTFSTKSDVYSFGVLLLEIVSGRKNTSFYDVDHLLNLIGHVCETNIIDCFSLNTIPCVFIFFIHILFPLPNFTKF